MWGLLGERKQGEWRPKARRKKEVRPTEMFTHLETSGEMSTWNEVCPLWDIGLIGDGSEVGKTLRNIQGLYA